MGDAMRTRSKDEDLKDRTPVLVIGGGPVGLVVSGLLAQRGIRNCVVERRREAQCAPAAHVLRKRPMEILDRLGVGEAVRRARSPLPLDFITWVTTLDGKEIGRLDLRPVDPETGVRGPEPWTNCAQNVLEPILLRHVETLPEARILRGAEWLGLDQGDDCVTARIRLEEGTESFVEASWVVAADGAGSPTRRRLGIPMEGPGPLARFAMIHFEADLTPWIRDRPGPILWIMNPESPGTLIVHDPGASHVFMMPMQGTRDGDGERAEREAIPARLAAALGVPVTPRILSIDEWSPHVQVAERYREGRVFLVGDAAHRFPPTGGLGLNTGIQEAADLVDRLAGVVSGTAPETLLDGYESTCRPVARANAHESFENMKRLGEITGVIGAPPDLKSLEERLSSFSREEAQRLARAIEAQRSHFLSDGLVPGDSASPSR